MFALLVLLPLVAGSDIIHFSPNSFVYADPPYFYHEERPKVDSIESEFGLFEPPRPSFQTRRNKTTNGGTSGEMPFINRNSKYQEFPEIDSETPPSINRNSKYEEFHDFAPPISIRNSTKINAVLKNYLSKLYRTKYANRGLKTQQSKIFFDDGFWLWKNKTKNLANKFLSLFTIVQFDNAQCQTTSSTGTYLGTCYHETQCANLNGTAMGACADGYGVCCVFRYSCGATSSRNCTYFESPGYPDYDPSGSGVLPPSTSTTPPTTTTNPAQVPDPRLKYHYEVHHRWARQTTSATSCTIDIYKLSGNVQQMRIDFIDLELTGPTNGTCDMERLLITGQNINNQVPIICGYNTGQQVYVDVSTLSGPLQLSVLSTTGERKRFKIRICQIAMDCSNSNNCLQYYTGVTGMISSFNYDQAAMANRSLPGYFNNLNYAICIRREAGYCSITYTNAPGGIEYQFQLVNVDEINYENDLSVGQSTVPPGQAGAEIFNCPEDYIVIGGVRLCGDKFNDGSMIEDFTMNAPVTDTTAGPFLIPVRTNEAVTGRGFKLFYTQNLCVTV